MRAQVSWGAFELVLAARNLLTAALTDPRNAKFIMLSESGVPLYPPAATYAQLIAEEKSRMESCGIHVRAPMPVLAPCFYHDTSCQGGPRDWILRSARGRPCALCGRWK